MNWTYHNVGKIWPNASTLLQLPPEPARREYLRLFLVTVQSRADQAYECLRFARWGEETGLRVTCPRCGKRAWKHSTNAGKSRWRCVTKEMYEQHQRTKGNTSKGSSRDGCGFTFDDTKGTPFERLPVPLGLVFLALYIPATQVSAWLRSLGDGVTAAALTQVLRALQQQEQADLRHRMRCMARLFCGRLLCSEHSPLMSFTGHRLVQSRMHRRNRELSSERAEKEQLLSDLPRHYQTIRSLLGKLERMHDAALHDRPVNMQRGMEIYQALVAEVAALAPRKAA
ncbi:MAG: hypothetical protein UZ03_NOB001000309 [Nitrospira sp. OLB3]|nr:MAG: hypothetical protein UZ03_NOB001000309 [Nitrospira sp. OLB3]